jgi:oligoendopeptidase F
MKEWNLNLLYKDISDPRFEKDIKTWQKDINIFIDKWKKDDSYTKDPAVLAKALDEYEKLLEKYTLSKPEYYIWLRRQLEQNNKELRAKDSILNDISLKLTNRIQFFPLNIAKIPKKYQSKFLNYKGLKDYKHYLKTSFENAKYLLTDREERVFNIKAKASHSNWIIMMEELLSKQQLNVIDEDGAKKQVPYSGISKYLNSTEQKVRNKAAIDFLKTNKKYSEISEYEINSILEDKEVSDEYRNIDRPDKTRHLSDDIDSEVVDTLLQVVTENFDIPKRFYKLKAKLLKKKNLRYFERNVPAHKIDTKYTFEKSKDIVKEVFTKLDPQFGDIFNSFVKNGQYDVYPKASKTGGAFCIHITKETPTYLLLNHTDELPDVLTLAHETGHGIHAELSKIQNSLNNGSSKATAEVASTFFEDFVLEEIKSNADDELKKNLLISKLEDSISTIFRQVACYNFELELHKSFRETGYLSKEAISELFAKHMKSYLGSTVVHDEHMDMGWVYWSHIRNFFYVYSYASGLLISKSLQSLVRKKPKDISKVKEFLSAGESMSPKEIFSTLGIDISKREFWEEGIKEIRSLLEEFENCLD